MVLTNPKLNNYSIPIKSVMSLVGVPLIVALSPAHAQQMPVVSYKPPNRGAPTISTPAGSRPWCSDPTGESENRSISRDVNSDINNELPLTLLAPALTHWGATSSAIPPIWLYVPDDIGTLKLVLIDEQTQALLHEITLPVQAEGAIAYLSLAAADMPPLEPEREYRLRFDFLCDGGVLAGQSSGVIEFQPVSPELQIQLDMAESPEQAQLLADAGIWYDAFHTVATQYCDEPDNPLWSQAWQDLLQHYVVGLNTMVDQPLFGCAAPR
ncbi:MAG: DUF928 domain-containing protein [Cyanobacteria bacterium P01_F01_bin.150]